MLSCWAACWVMEANSDPTVTLWGEFTHSRCSREMVLLVDFLHWHLPTSSCKDLHENGGVIRNLFAHILLLETQPYDWSRWQLCTLHAPHPHSSPTPQKVLLAFWMKRRKYSKRPARLSTSPLPVLGATVLPRGFLWARAPPPWSWWAADVCHVRWGKYLLILFL